MKTKIVGTQFAKARAEGINEGSEILIVHDTDNQYDDKALAVLFNEERIGYVGKGTDVYDLPRESFPKSGKVLDFYIRAEDDDTYNKHEVGTLVSCNIEIPVKVESQQPVLRDKDNVKSFNEEGVIINFNEATHTYTYKGQVLKGATTYIKRYIKPFDDAMVGRCATSWNLDSQLIRNAWELGKDLAASFGTGVHKALEFEDLYRHYYKKNGTRCFTIKHPVIRRIVEEFFELEQRLGFEGQVIPEALVSDVENGVCGLADRILVTDWDKKTCRIQDYKVNHSFDVKGKVTFENLPKGIVLDTTKLSKLSLQLKFHATMLEKQGWTVEGFDGFVYNDKWEYYEPNMLDGFDIMG